jgi:hypothetical protein
VGTVFPRGRRLALHSDKASKQLKHALTLIAIPGFFQTKSLSPDLLFAYSSKK